MRIWGRLVYRIAAIAVILTALSLVSCGGDALELREDAELTLEAVRGTVLEVRSESLISLSALEVEDAEGVVWSFEGRGKVVPGFTPSHLNEHKLLGLTVEVTFYREGTALVIYNITD